VWMNAGRGAVGCGFLQNRRIEDECDNLPIFQKSVFFWGFWPEVGDTFAANKKVSQEPKNPKNMIKHRATDRDTWCQSDILP